MTKEIVIIVIVIFLLILWFSCKVSGSYSRKEEQEEARRKLEGQEQKLDDSNWQDDLVYDEEFIKKEDK